MFAPFDSEVEWNIGTWVKLDMDCATRLSLRARRRCGMEDDDRNALIGQLFGLMTALFEDGAGRALDGHKPMGTDIMALATELRHYATDIIALLDTAEVVHRMGD